MKYPILYQQGSSYFEDILIEKVPEHWKEWHAGLKVFWKNWIDFCELHPEYSKYKMPSVNPNDEKDYSRYKNTRRFQWLEKWENDWINFNKSL